MKKSFYTVTLLFALTVFFIAPVHAKRHSESTMPKTIYYGGHKGDFAMSFSVLPVINFIGNMFNGTTSQYFTGFSSVTPSLFSGSALSGKYFITDKLNVTVGAGFNNTSNKAHTYDDSNEVKESVKTTGNKEIMFLVGTHYLLRPGKRLQPIIGANLVYAYANKNFEKYDDKDDADADYNSKHPSNTFGLIANLGIEFYLSKSISLSALLDLGLINTTSRISYHDSEEDYSYIQSSQTKFQTGKMGGNLALNFYF